MLSKISLLIVYMVPQHRPEEITKYKRTESDRSRRAETGSSLAQRIHLHLGRASNLLRPNNYLALIARAKGDS